MNSLMRSGAIVMIHILTQYPNQMPLIEDQDVVQTLFTHRSHPAFREGICFGCSIWREEDVRAFGDKDRVERSREFRQVKR